MLRRMTIASLVLIFAMPSFAQSVKLTTAEISTLLMGNTAVGVWEGAKYRHFLIKTELSFLPKRVVNPRWVNGELTRAATSTKAFGQGMWSGKVGT